MKNKKKGLSISSLRLNPAKYIYVWYVILCGLLVLSFYADFFTHNATFDDFQIGSENLAISRIAASINHIEWDRTAFGLGFLYERSGYSISNIPNSPAQSNLLTNDAYRNGLSIASSALAVPNNGYNALAYVTANSIRLKNGETRKIISIKTDEKTIYVSLEGTSPLDESIHGGINDYQIFNSDGVRIKDYILTDYLAQVGLQGWVYYWFAKLIPIQTVNILRLICSILLAVVLFWICLEIKQKYNLLMAISFYVTFLLSTWVVNFARNLYWVEFTWFIPMLLGLLCLNNWKRRRYFYPLFYFAILIKSLCGYEYITTVMMGSIMFLLVELFSSQKTEKTSRKELLSAIFWIGILSILAFATALMIHSAIRGHGNIWDGLTTIYKQDVLRRTLGGNPSDYAEVFAGSLNASIFDVLKGYIIFSTPIILGLDGQLFRVIILLPMLIFAYQFLFQH
ncbi:MAG TPA: hypothetical protein PKW33_03625 [Anaerolineaceae bacterium]|nr:hypothetical protein [Anaerolineaceae bacterium]HPN50652.1 hypothetical protein [Anaerolineaceae bacterium]